MSVSAYLYVIIAHSCLVKCRFKNASTSVFNTAKWAHFVDHLSHKYSTKCTVWHIKFPKFSLSPMLNIKLAPMLTLPINFRVLSNHGDGKINVAATTTSHANLFPVCNDFISRCTKVRSQRWPEVSRYSASKLRESGT